MIEEPLVGCCVCVTFRLTFIQAQREDRRSMVQVHVCNDHNLYPVQKEVVYIEPSRNRQPNENKAYLAE